MTETGNHARRRARGEDGEPTEAMREYLEVIYYLGARNEPVISARLAEWMRVSAPTVTDMVKRMERRGYISRDGRGEIRLTEEGFTVAEAMVRRHRILERFLVDVMGIPWHQIHEEAVRMERALSPTMEARIEALVGASATCPHGNPIPGNSSVYPGALRLDQAGAGQRFIVQRIAEEAEEQTDLIRFLQSHDLVPGARFEVAERGPAGEVELRRDGARLGVPAPIAAVIWGDLA